MDFHNLEYALVHVLTLQQSCNSPAKNNFVRATFRKLRVMCDHVRKNAEASSKTKTLVQTLIIYIMKAN